MVSGKVGMCFDGVSVLFLTRACVSRYGAMLTYSPKINVFIYLF